MKRFQTLLLTFCISLFALPVISQNVSEGSQAFMKKENGNALSILIQGQPKNVTSVMDQMFRKATSSKPRVKSGLKSYEGVHHSGISRDRLDIYYSVDKASRNDKNSSRVSLFLSSGNGNFLTSDTYPEEMANATDILQGLQYEVKMYEMELAIADQEKVIQKAIKEQQKLEADSVSLEAKLAETIQAIEENKVARANQIRTIEEEEANLAEFRAQLEETRGIATDAATTRRMAREAGKVARKAKLIDETTTEEEGEGEKEEEGDGGN